MKAAKEITVFLSSLILVLAFSTVAQAEKIEGSFWYTLDHLTSAQDDAQAVIWITLPPVWHGQDIKVSSIVPEPVAVLEDENTGNRVVEWVFRPGEDALPMNQFFHFEFTLDQRPVGYDVDPEKVEAYDRGSEEYKVYTKAETWIQIDGKVLDAAREIVGTEKNPWLQTRALFDWCMQSLTFAPGGFGDRDALATLAGRKGDCGQYGRLFVGLCRSIGIPARTVSNEWVSGGSHVFVEVKMPGYGWVPVDISLAQMLQPGGAGFTEKEVENFMAERDVPLGDPYWFLGHLFSSRLITSVGNNITINSPTLGRQITFKSMKPGGARAFPDAFVLEGFNDDLIHGGFFVFGEKIESDEDAHKMSHMRLANLYFNVGLYDVVAEGCRKSLNDYSYGVQSWINMGKVYMHKGEYYKAEATFKRAIIGVADRRDEELETLVWTHNYLGNCYDLLNHRDMAITEYQMVIDMDNNYRGAVDYAKKYIKQPFTKKSPK